MAMIPLIGDLVKAGKWTVKLGQGALDLGLGIALKQIAPDLLQKTAKESLEALSEKAAQQTGKKVLGLQWVQTALDVVGCVPGTSDAATAINTLISLGRGKYFNAAMSAVSAVPLVGAVVTTGARVIGDSLDRLTRQVADEMREKAIKEATEETAEKLVKEGGEGLAKKVTKETVEEGTEKLSKNVIAASAPKATKEVLKEAADKTINKVQKELREDAFIEHIVNRDSDSRPKVAEDQVIKQPAKVTPVRDVHVPSASPEKQKYDSLVSKHGKRAADALNALPPADANKLLTTLDEKSLDHAIQEGPDAVAALSGWSEKDLQQHGAELALRSKKDAEALTAVQELVDSGPIDPKNLTPQQKALIEKIAEYSTQNPDQARAVLGKWVDISNGFVKRAQDTNSLHYNPHPDMWNKLESLGREKQEEVAWLINQQVIQNGISKGLSFEYSLNGVPDDTIESEHDTIMAIFSGQSDEEIMLNQQRDYLPIRMKELRVLQQAGYSSAFDEALNSYMLKK
jgi:hypothetical protein